MQGRIEIRLLGRFSVRRPDGHVVDDNDWRTGKTVDLLRLLALEPDRSVMVDGILNTLWPGVDEAKARASLRNSVARIRRVLGTASIDRHLDHLALKNAWVDVSAFRLRALDVNAAIRAQDHPQVVSLAREAESLYGADFTAHDDKSSWATEVRDSLRLKRQTMLADAAESAIQLLWMRDAIDFSTLAISSDPCFERAYRSLMQAHFGLGETEMALRAFERCRFNLATELGASPSAQTIATHRQISVRRSSDAAAPFTGRDSQIGELAAALLKAITSDGVDVFCLTGPVNSGRSTLLETAVGHVPHGRIRHLVGDHHGISLAAQLLTAPGSSGSDIFAFTEASGDAELESYRLLEFLNTLEMSTKHTVVLITSNACGTLIEDGLQDSPFRRHRFRTTPITKADLEELATSILSAPPTPNLLKVLYQQSHRLIEKAKAILRDWIASGRIISTQHGVDLYDEAAAVTGIPPVGNTFRNLLARLTVDELEFFQLVAMSEGPITATELKRLMNSHAPDVPHGLDDVQRYLDKLADSDILHFDGTGYVLRNLAIRDSVASWLRPATRSRITREFEALSPGLRRQH